MRRFLKKLSTITLIAAVILTATLPVFTVESQADVVKGNGFTRIRGKDRYEISLEVATQYKKQKRMSSFKTVILATGGNYQDSISASYLASVTDAPIILVSSSTLTSVNSYLNKNMKSGGTVYIVGGPKAVSTSYDTRLKTKYTVKRLGGKDAYDTNLLILNEADKIYASSTGGKYKKEVLVCSGKNFPDAVSAGATGHPILLVKNKLNAEQKAYLKNRKKSNYHVIGGNLAVSDSIKKEVSAYGTVSRHGGATQHETAVKVAEKFFPTMPQNAIVVNGNDFYYGVMAGPLAQALKCPILTINEKNIAQAYNYEKSHKVKHTYIIGNGNDVAKKAVATNNAFQTGFNKYGDKYVYVKKSGLMAIKNFEYYYYDVTTTRGGMIKAKYAEEGMRRKRAINLGPGIVIFIEGQRLYFVDGGKIVFETDVITGMKDEFDTPTGNYYVRGKARDVHLINYDYDVFVEYWMPFIGNLYGIHSCDWRSKFGGTQYLTKGSHGCVNVPWQLMPKLWKLTSVGTDVTIRKR